MIEKEDILTLLDLPNDGALIIEEISEKEGIKSVILSRRLEPTYCPICCNRMHSKGIYTRTVNHSIYQDKTHLSLKIKQRRWHCKNCNYTKNDEFPFLEQ